MRIKNTPLVFFNGDYPNLMQKPRLNVVYVVTDGYGGAFKATAELIRLGHRTLDGKKEENLVMP